MAETESRTRSKTASHRRASGHWLMTPSWTCTAPGRRGGICPTRDPASENCCAGAGVDWGSAAMSGTSRAKMAILMVGTSNCNLQLVSCLHQAPLPALEHHLRLLLDSHRASCSTSPSPFAPYSSRRAVPTTRKSAGPAVHLSLRAWSSSTRCMYPGNARREMLHLNRCQDLSGTRITLQQLSEVCGRARLPGGRRQSGRSGGTALRYTPSGLRAHEH